MADATAVAMGVDGAAVVVKRGDVRRIQHESAMLRRAACPGVVALAAPADQCLAADDVVCTAFVGGATLAERLRRPLDAALALQLATSLAATVADLHDRGIAHRRLSADHVLVVGDTAVLCGFAEAVLVSESDAGVLSGDVAAVARLVDELAAASAGRGADILRQVAGRALGASAEGGPSMRGMARMLQASGTAAGSPTAPRRAGNRALLPRAARTRTGRRFPPAVLGASIVVALLLTAGGVFVAVDDDASTVAAPTSTTVSPRPAHVPEPSTTSTSAPTPRRLWPPSSCPEVAAALTADIDGDGCDEDVRIDAGIVSSADRHWEVAGTDDIVVLGDWDCDGRATPAVLRPETGGLWVFSRWAGVGEEVAATLAGVVADAASARTVEPPDSSAPGCDRIEVLHPDDTTTVVTPPLPPSLSRSAP
ncbi:MAG: hypothetical protein KY450_06145 [Actinobacteria bacterium]|nr:hypothetical protein [Actinomycetota bacterium]